MPPSLRVAACLISGDGTSPEDWKECLGSLERAGIAETFVAFNGEGPIPNLTSYVESMRVNVHTFDWEDDFALARNQSLAMMPRHEFTHWIWIDTDDSLDEAHEGAFIDLVEELDPRVMQTFLQYDYAVDPESGIVIVRQRRERLFSNLVRWKWQYPVHENVAGPPIGIDYANRMYDECGVVVRHRRFDPDGEFARPRNRRLVAKALRLYPDVPIFEFYMANEVLHEAEMCEVPEEKRTLYEASLRAYSRFMERTGQYTDYTYIANHRRADIWRRLGDHATAINCDLQGVKMYPHWPDSPNGIADSFLATGDYARCEEWSSFVLAHAAAPITLQGFEPAELDYIPRQTRGAARCLQGKIVDGLEDLRIAQEIYPTDQLAKQIGQFEELLDEVGDADDLPDERVEYYRRVECEECGGTGDWTGWSGDDEHTQEGACRSCEGTGFVSPPSRPLGQFVQGTAPRLFRKRSIAFFTLPLFEPWNPEIEAKQGIGGAETCVIRLAPRFAEAGWEVHVFGTPGEGKGYHDDVGWWDSADWNSRDKFDVLVSSRAPMIFDAEPEASIKMLWCHDVNYQGELTPDAGEFGDRLDQIDAVIALSPWHKKHLKRLYDIDANIVPNGVDLDLYAREPELVTDPRFVWSSSPDRGLDVLLWIWPGIRDAFPEATLEVFYGWAGIDKILSMIPRNDPQYVRLSSFREWITTYVDYLNVGENTADSIIWRDRQPQSVLAESQYSAQICAYPAYFMETFCITMIEAQLAGAIPVASDLAALSSTIACKDLLVRGYPNNQTYRRQFLDRTIDLLRSPDSEKIDRIRRGREHALGFGWDSSFRAWEDLIGSLSR